MTAGGGRRPAGGVSSQGPSLLPLIVAETQSAKNAIGRNPWQNNAVVVDVTSTPDKCPRYFRRPAAPDGMPAAAAFTMSIQTMPPGNRIPVHCHETEEVFLILDGECLVRCWDGEASFEIRLGRWDLVALPPFLQHEVFNEGAGDCQVQTLLAKPKPLHPQYADPDLLKLQAEQG